VDFARHNFFLIAGFDWKGKAIAYSKPPSPTFATAQEFAKRKAVFLNNK